MDSPSELSKVKLYYEYPPEYMEVTKAVRAFKRRAARAMKQQQIKLATAALSVFVKD
ncbi:MAG: hypothetical protein WA972_05875 [Rhodococcus qingshengii]